MNGKTMEDKSDMRKDINAVHAFVETYARALERDRVPFTGKHIGILEMHLLKENILSPSKKEARAAEENALLDERIDVDYFAKIKHSGKKIIAAMETLAIYASQARREVVHPLTNRYALAVYHLSLAGHSYDKKLGTNVLCCLRDYLRQKGLLPPQQNKT